MKSSNKAGITTSVSSVLLANPPIITAASGCSNSLPGPPSTANGIIPSAAVSAARAPRSTDMRSAYLLFVTGCAMGGAMHQATLVGQCATDDAACSRRHPVAPIAIGARFHPEVATSIDGTTTPNLRLESAAGDVLAVEDGALVARQPGTSAVLISTEDGAVVDFIHMWAAPVTQITLASKLLAVGDRVVVVATKRADGSLASNRVMLAAK